MYDQFTELLQLCICHYEEIDTHIQHIYTHSQFCGVVDLLILPAAITQSQSSFSGGVKEAAATENMEVTCEEGAERIEENGHFEQEDLLLLSWKRLQTVLERTFSEALELKEQGRGNSSLLHCLDHVHTSKTSDRFVKGRRADMLHLLCEHLSAAMSRLLSASSGEELQVMMEQLLSIEVHVK